MCVARSRRRSREMLGGYSLCGHLQALFSSRADIGSHFEVVVVTDHEYAIPRFF